MNDVDAIFFDNDGVLVDTEHLYFQATREILAEADIAFDEEGYHRWFLSEGTGAWHLASERGASPERVQAMRQARDDRYAALLAEALAKPGSLVLPGVRDALTSLSARFPMAVVTSAKRVHFDQLHATSGLLAHFRFTLTAEDHARTKPDPAPYLAAIARMGVPAARCIVVEDSERGLRAAKAAGLRCVVIPTGLTHRGDFRAADLVLESLAQLTARLSRRP